MNQFDKDIQRAEQQLASLGKRIAAVLPEAVEKAAKVTKPEIARRAARRTGRMAESVDDRPGEVTGNSAEHLVFVSAFYSPYVEYGTRRARARPFFRPGIAATRRAAVQEIEKVVRSVSRSDYRGG